MPQIKFTDSTLKSLSTTKTTWFSDPSCKGLRLCVTKSGVKTWYVTKWDSGAQKTRSVKLAQWASKGAHCAWAKKQMGATLLDIHEGNVLTKDERETQKAALGIPTFAEALEQYIEHRTSERASGKAPMVEKTAKDYRNTFNLRFSRWADVHVDELPILEINQYLNALQLTRPHGARTASVLAGAVVRFVNRLCALALPIPSLLDNTTIKSRVETGKLDLSVPWADRWAEIEQIPNEHIRLWWMLTWYTGFRQETFRALTWDQVDLKNGAITFRRSKHTYDRRIAVSDDAVRMLKRLRKIRYDDCDWVFPSRRIIGDQRKHLGQIDGLELTNPGDLRHFWMTAAREVCPRHVHRWLAQQTLTDNDLRMLGHYGEPSFDEQKRGADAIAEAINKQLEDAPCNVVEIGRKHA